MYDIGGYDDHRDDHSGDVGEVVVRMFTKCK